VSGKRFNVAVLGAGIGSAHAAGYHAWPERFRVATMCDLDLTRAAEAVKDIPNVKLTDKLSDVLNHDEIDIVSIGLPPHLHYPVMMDALRAGKHVVGEKPFTTSLKDAHAAIALAKEKNLRVFPVFQYRYGAGYQRLLLLQERGLLGKPYAASIETHWKRGAGYYEIPWRGTWKGECGGSIVGHAIHVHNLLTRVLGRVSKVAAFLDTRVNDIETEDTAAISFQMENGALATSSVTLGAANDTSRLRLCFEHVTAQSGDQPYSIGAGEWTFVAWDPDRQKEIDAVINEVDADVPHRFEGFCREIYNELTGAEGAAATNLEDALHSIELITAIYHAARTETVVTLPLDETHPLYGGWFPAEAQ